MSVDTTFRNREQKEIVGEPEVVEDGAVRIVESTDHSQADAISI